MYTTASERAPAQAANRQPKGIVFGLAKADLRHEWLLTMCLLMAVAAVLAPLLLLFGLKYGTIETLRSRLVQDPRNRAIKPLISRSFTPAWFARMQPRLDIGFIIPTTRQISATITARVKTGQAKAELNLIPTGEHDPLLLENGVSIPGQGTCVLTHFAAEELNAQIGDTILTTAKRIVAGQYEAGDMELRVVGILSLRASALKSMYVPLDVLEAVERFKDGQAVPEFDWPGSTPTAYPQYDGLIIILPRKLTAIEAFHLRNNTGFSTIAELTHAELRAKTFIDLGEDGHLYFLATQQKPVGAQSIATVRHKLRGKQATLLPWVAPMPAQLRDASGADIARLTLYPLSIPPQKAAALELTPHPPWDGDETTLKIMLPAHLAAPSDGLTMHISNGKTA
ncbi:MAG: hypothetical protein OEU26_28780, partial [Candidatus Tectomicrobia bacterium]|nr:hypothetical protein [Candidatus Tectomicrobia bacterium]